MISRQVNDTTILYINFLKCKHTGVNLYRKSSSWGEASLWNMCRYYCVCFWWSCDSLGSNSRDSIHIGVVEVTSYIIIVKNHFKPEKWYANLQVVVTGGFADLRADRNALASEFPTVVAANVILQLADTSFQAREIISEWHSYKLI